VKRFLGLVIAVSLVNINSASAFGLGDIVSAGINVVGKVGGAMIDKATEDTPEEMEQKRQQEKADRERQYFEAVAKIEARTDITPLSKEKLTRQIAKSFGMAETISNLMAQQEAQRREQRDNMFTAGGMAGVVGGAVLSTPSAVIARADLAVKTGVPQAQSRQAVAEADVMIKTGLPQAQSSSAVAVASGEAPTTPAGIAIIQPVVTVPQKAIAEDAIQGNITEHQIAIADEQSTLIAAKPKQELSEPELSNLASLDKNRKIYVEFIGSQKLTTRLQDAFKAAGYLVVSTEAESEAVYQFDGEYGIQAEGNRGGLNERVGAYSEDPRVLEGPQVQSGVKNVVGGFFAAMAGVPIKRPELGGYKQGVLLVANRRVDGKDVRVSAVSSEESMQLEPTKLIETALQEIMGAVGVHDAVPSLSVESTSVEGNAPSIVTASASASASASAPDDVKQIFSQNRQ